MKGIQVKRAVEKYYGVNTSLNTRDRVVALPRQVGMYLCRKRTNLSYMQIARIYNRSHDTTAMHAEKKVTIMCKDDKFKREIEGII